jgi:hypothetical protein
MVIDVRDSCRQYVAATATAAAMATAIATATATATAVLTSYDDVEQCEFSA